MSRYVIICARVHGRYCSSCASLFRVHIMYSKGLRTKKCSRVRPCERCARVLTGFKPSLESVFAVIDAQEKLRESNRATKTAASRLREPAMAANTLAECQFCKSSTHSGQLGSFWAKYGYIGPPYCSHCSLTFRNHIVRQRKPTGCSRLKPCLKCSAIMSCFDTNDRDRIYGRMDRKNVRLSTMAMIPR